MQSQRYAALHNQYVMHSRFVESVTDHTHVCKCIDQIIVFNLFQCILPNTKCLYCNTMHVAPETLSKVLGIKCSG